VRPNVAFGFAMLNVNDVVPLSGSVVAPKALVMLGGVPTDKLAVAVFPVPPLVEDTGPDMLVKEPAVAPSTFATTVHELFTAMPPPTKLMLVPPAVAKAVPPQVFARPFGVATTKPVGSVSANATPASATVLAAGFVIVKVSDVVPFNAIDVGLNALAIDGGATTASVAVAVFPVPPLVELTAPDVFVNEPGVAASTFATTVHELFPAIVPPVKLMLVPPAVAEAAPPQLFVKPFGVATTKPVGSVSLNATPLSATVLPVGLVIVNVSALVPFTGMELGLNPLAIDGGATTVKVAVLLAAPGPL